jgi:hypothetical protein
VSSTTTLDDIAEQLRDPIDILLRAGEVGAVKILLVQNGQRAYDAMQGTQDAEPQVTVVAVTPIPRKRDGIGKEVSKR